MNNTEFAFVHEWTSPLLQIFQHRWDYIWAEHPKAWDSPTWHTESRHPLADRHIQQGAFLYGVRFGAETDYCLLDIDSGSLYHPKRDPYAITRMMAALEPIGLVSFVAVTSSYSGGIHLYFPFEKKQKSWELAAAVTVLLENAGFTLQSGWLEVFPNPKPYEEEQKTLYKAHRLPLQIGCYLLSEDWQLCHTSPEAFCQRWEWSRKRNDIDAGNLQRVAAAARRKKYRLTGKATKFLNDLNAEIEPGWTAHGQTNAILGRIALRSYCFGHLLRGGEPLSGDRLIAEIVAVATQLPGYRYWCRHQHEIGKRAEEWARCVESCPRYFPYGHRPLEATGPEVATGDPLARELLQTWNRWQQHRAREKICFAVAELLESSSLPAGAKARFNALIRYGLGGGTLYANRDLWHPDHLWKTPPDPPNFSSPFAGKSIACAGLPDERGTNLLSPIGRNHTPSEGFSDSVTLDSGSTGRNHTPSEGFSDLGSESDERV